MYDCHKRASCVSPGSLCLLCIRTAPRHLYIYVYTHPITPLLGAWFLTERSSSELPYIYTYIYIYIYVLVWHQKLPKALKKSQGAPRTKSVTIHDQARPIACTRLLPVRYPTVIDPNRLLDDLNPTQPRSRYQIVPIPTRSLYDIYSIYSTDSTCTHLFIHQTYLLFEEEA